MIEQRREAGPRLLVHAVSLIENADASCEHRRDERRSVVDDLAALGQHRRHEQIFRSRVRRALVDVKRLLPDTRPSDGQRRLADPRSSDQPGSQRQIDIIDQQPTRQQLLEHFPLPDPLPFGRIRLGQEETHAANFHRFRHRMKNPLSVHEVQRHRIALVHATGRTAQERSCFPNTTVTTNETECCHGPRHNNRWKTPAYFFLGASADFFFESPFVNDSKASRYSGGGGRRTGPMPSPVCFSLFESSRR
ncbi:MAG: hypothetical protein FD138_1473 [Planctomycetota bacterium]|nr:MAG: hypothetical protein FD138_1473 [Planctomycetota bacterium]